MISYPYSSKDLNILSILDKLPSIKVLDLSGLKLDLNCALKIRNHLYYYKVIQVLDLSNTTITEEMSKEIADGIMKAKSLEKIYLENTGMVKGLSNILYNLAFQPTIKIVDISNNSTCDAKETATSIYKLIKMSNSIQILICRNVNNLNSCLTQDFYTSLGDNASLSYLDLSNSGPIQDYANFAKSIALNGYKKGKLKKLLLSGINLNFNNLMNMINNFEITENEHFSRYGYLFSNIQKDSKEYYEKKIHM
jgi:hypothetical protein